MSMLETVESPRGWKAQQSLARSRMGLRFKRRAALRRGQVEPLVDHNGRPTADTSALIDAALAAGNIVKIPRGVSGLPGERLTLQERRAPRGK